MHAVSCAAQGVPLARPLKREGHKREGQVSHLSGAGVTGGLYAVSCGTQQSHLAACAGANG